MMTAAITGSSRVALYGGAFDPVHNAHLRVARYALKQVGLDRVIFIPAAQSPLKAHAPLASDEERVEMLELATDGERSFAVDTYEIEKGGLSYTIDTVRHFRACAPEAEWFWLVGADQFEQLDRWHAIHELAELVTFLVFGRPGADMRPCDIEGLDYLQVDAPLMEESSSEIRRRCGRGVGLEGFVPSAVEAFISERGLYTDPQ